MSTATATATPRVLSATSIVGDKVINANGDDLGKIEEIMLDLDFGRISYAVLSFGGFLGLGDKFFALPWDALQLDAEKEAFILNVPKEVLKNASGFDKENWPDFTDRGWGSQVYTHFGHKIYW